MATRACGSKPTEVRILMAGGTIRRFAAEFDNPLRARACFLLLHMAGHTGDFCMSLCQREFGSCTVVEVGLLEPGLGVASATIFDKISLVWIVMAVGAEPVGQFDFCRRLLVACGTLHSRMGADESKRRF